MKKTLVTPLLDREKADPSVNVDTMNNDPGEFDMDENGNLIIDAKPLPAETVIKKVLQINQFTPMTIMTTKSPNGNDIAALVLLCKDKMSDETFTITHNYIIENDEQKKQIEKNPIHDNVNYISKRLTANMIMNTIPGYISDLCFYYNKNTSNPNDAFFMYGVPNDGSKDIVLFQFNAETFSALAFMDDYIVSDSHNIHDLQIATVAGYQQSGTLVTVHFVDEIDSIVSMAPTDEKKSTDLAIVFKILEFDSADTKNVYKILTAFNFGKKYQPKKYRGYTIKRMEDEYGKDIDQYISNYMIECRLKNLGKDYLIIKAKNKDGICKLFFIDNDTQRKLEEMVEAY